MPNANLALLFPSTTARFFWLVAGSPQLGDPRFGRRRLTVFGVDQLGDQLDLLRTWYPNCAFVPLLLLSDAAEQGAFGIGLDGKSCWVHAKDNAIDVGARSKASS